MGDYSPSPSSLAGTGTHCGRCHSPASQTPSRFIRGCSSQVLPQTQKDRQPEDWRPIAWVRRGLRGGWRESGRQRGRRIVDRGALGHTFGGHRGQLVDHVLKSHRIGIASGKQVV